MNESLHKKKTCLSVMLVVLAAVPMVEAMVALVLVDQLMLQRAQGELFPINSALQQPVELPGLEAASLPN